MDDYRFIYFVIIVWASVVVSLAIDVNNLEKRINWIEHSKMTLKKDIADLQSENIDLRNKIYRLELTK